MCAFSELAYFVLFGFILRADPKDEKCSLPEVTQLDRNTKDEWQTVTRSHVFLRLPPYLQGPPTIPQSKEQTLSNGFHQKRGMLGLQAVCSIAI